MKLLIYVHVQKTEIVYLGNLVEYFAQDIILALNYLKLFILILFILKFNKTMLPIWKCNKGLKMKSCFDKKLLLLVAFYYYLVWSLHDLGWYSYDRFFWPSLFMHIIT